MNVELVFITATAIARWLPADSEVVIGRDHRHGSEDFARVTAEVLADHGHRPQVFSGVVPTPVVAYTVASTDAAAGVMVTASHNPATDNGYKVYVADGGQLLPGQAAEIESLMAAQPWPSQEDLRRLAHLSGAPISSDLSVGGYVEAVRQPAGKGVRIAYTAMHGVGGDLFVRVLRDAGHEVHTVPEQHEPDPDFPTAAFPNPEEPGTLDLVCHLAEDVNADIVLANDPDADRLAVAVKRRGSWERLTGDQIGALLGWFTLDGATRPCTVATTIVSSTLLGKIAESRDASLETTLTGFKWLSRAGSPAAPLVFAYEEALGYSVDPQVVRDKDGISAGLAFAALIAGLKESNRSIDDLLAELYEEFGTHLNAQVTNRFETARPMDDMTALMAALRHQPPTEVGGLAVTATLDLADGTAELPPSDVLVFHVAGGRVIVRPSGTEPKIKAYIEAVDPEPTTAKARLEQLRQGAARLIS